MTVATPRDQQQSQQTIDEYFHTEIQRRCKQLKSEKERREAAKALLFSEPPFIHNAEFESTTVQQIEDHRHTAPLFGKTPRKLDQSDLFDRMAASPLLTQHGETFFFRRMNFMLFWASVFRSRLPPNRATALSIARIQVLLDEAKSDQSTIVNANLRLVLSQARKFSQTEQEFEELVSEGSLILVNATNKFDYARGFRFSTYATHSLQRNVFRYWSRKQRHAERWPTASPDLLADTVSVQPDQQTVIMDAAIVEDLLRVFSTTLDDREQWVLKERFGMNAARTSRTLRELGTVLGVSKERVRQLQVQAIEKIQEVTTDPHCDESSP